MQSLAAQMSVYQKYHRQEITKITHFVGIPCIIFALLILLSFVHISITGVFNITLAWIAVAALVIYYFFLDIFLALITAVFLILLTLLAHFCSQDKISVFSITLFLIFFIGGWIMQFIGHYFEGKRPAFMDSVTQLFVAPIFIVAELIFALGYKKTLQRKVLELAGQ